MENLLRSTVEKTPLSPFQKLLGQQYLRFLAGMLEYVEQPSQH